MRNDARVADVAGRLERELAKTIVGQQRVIREIARATGGRLFPSDRSYALVAAMGATYPARTVTRAVHPMRSAWSAMAFAGLLCAEWAVRRKRGLS